MNSFSKRFVLQWEGKEGNVLEWVEILRRRAHRAFASRTPTETFTQHQKNRVDFNVQTINYILET